MVYILMFQLAFQITLKVNKIKEVIEVKLAELTVPHQIKYCEKIVKSITRLSLKVAGFHEVERDSIPRFLDFVVTQIVSLLLTFK